MLACVKKEVEFPLGSYGTLPAAFSFGMAIAAGKPRAAAASWFRPSTLLVLALSVADGLSARAWLNGGTSPSPLIIGGGASSQSKLELPLLPTGATPLLPGEALDIQLIGNPAARLLLQYAEDNHQSCCGQLLTRGDPNAAEQELIGVTSLLEIVPYAKGGLPRAARVLYEEGDSVRLQCVGRVRIVGLDQPEGAVLGGGDGGFMVAQVEPYFDEEDGETQQEISAALAASLPLAAELSGEDDDAQQQISEALAASLNGGGGGDATLESSMAEAAAKAVAASAEGAGTSAAEVLAAAQKLLEGLDDEVRPSHPLHPLYPLHPPAPLQPAAPAAPAVPSASLGRPRRRCARRTPPWPSCAAACGRRPRPSRSRICAAISRGWGRSAQTRSRRSSPRAVPCCSLRVAVRRRRRRVTRRRWWRGCCATNFLRCGAPRRRVPRSASYSPSPPQRHAAALCAATHSWPAARRSDSRRRCAGCARSGAV